MIGMAGFSVYAHEKSYDIPKIEPDPMEDRVADLKYRIYRQQMKSEQEKNVRVQENKTIKKIIKRRKSEIIIIKFIYLQFNFEKTVI